MRLVEVWARSPTTTARAGGIGWAGRAGRVRTGSTIGLQEDAFTGQGRTPLIISAETPASPITALLWAADRFTAPGHLMEIWGATPTVTACRFLCLLRQVCLGTCR